MTRQQTQSNASADRIDHRADDAGMHETLLTPEASNFLLALHEQFARAIDDRLKARREWQQAVDDGQDPDFGEDTRDIREAEWRITPPPADLVDRRVEITGPPDRRMVVNALNSGARVFMADFEDALSPTWDNVLAGQRNVADAIRRQIDFTAEDGREYRLCDEPAVLIVRPRGLHLPERHFRVDGEPIPASLFDFGLHVFHNARELLARGSGPYLYLPKLENHQEARLWARILAFSEEYLGLEPGTIRVTVLIETLPAVFEMDEILYELRQSICGLNCGRWDYIFSYIKVFRSRPDRVLPNREQVGMDRDFLRAYSRLLIQTCHRRGAHAMGGMAAQIPVRDDDAANQAALDKVRADKEREAGDGHDGTWVAHPALIPVAREVFDRHMDGPNQIDRELPGLVIDRHDLLKTPDGTITEDGLRSNLGVGLRYLGAWLDGRGCVPIRNLMEDAATAEIARSQVWQWIHHERGTLEDGRRVTPHFVRDILRDELAALEGESDGRWQEAAEIIETLVNADELTEFLTIPAYERLT